MNRDSQPTCWTQGEGGYFDVSDVDADPSGQLGGLVTAAEWDESINVGKITETPRHYICEAPIGMEGVALGEARAMHQCVWVLSVLADACLSVCLSVCLSGWVCVHIDDCVDDPDKVSPGMCGCGVKDIDSDLDGLMDCLGRSAHTNTHTLTRAPTHTDTLPLSCPCACRLRFRPR